MFRQIIERFTYRIDERYQQEFHDQVYANNLERAYLVSVMGVGFFFLLIVSEFLASEVNELDVLINSALFITHALLAFLLIPGFFMQDPTKESLLTTLYSNKRHLVHLTLAIIGISLIPMALVSLNNTGSVVVFSIYVIIINLGFKLPRRVSIGANVISFIMVTVGIIYIQSPYGASTVVSTLLECWALMAAVFVIGFYQFHYEIKQFNAEKLLEEQNRIIESQLKSEFDKKIAEVEMTALRSQMNPHFLFNVLNSIKLYMVQNDARTAARYLTKFSRLIRLILNNSKSPMVKLSEELHSLKLYIEMENFRFNDKFDYEIKVDDSINTEEIDIPPMILQPYVENAIWHGLMHKEIGRGRLLIDLRPSETNSTIHFIIEDNGIGRERAMQIRTRTAAKHRSVGMEITQDRISISNKLFDTNASVEIIDLKDKTGGSLGTKVVLHLPVAAHKEEET